MKSLELQIKLFQNGRQEGSIVNDTKQDMTISRLYTACSSKVNFTDNSELEYIQNSDCPFFVKKIRDFYGIM